MHTTGKPFNIDKKQVYEAYQAVKSNGGAAGVDGLQPASRISAGDHFRTWTAQIVLAYDR